MLCGGAGGEVGVDAFGIAGRDLQLRVIAAADADEHAGSTPGQFRWSLAAALQRFPDDLQQQTLLRVHLEDFARRNSEEVRIEPIHRIQEAAAARVHLSRNAGIGVVIGIHIPPVGRNFTDAIRAVAQDAPKSFRIVGASGESTTHADDRDRLAQSAQVRLQLVKLEQRALQQGSIVACFGGAVHKISLRICDLEPIQFFLQQRRQFAFGKFLESFIALRVAAPLRLTPASRAPNGGCSRVRRQNVV